MVVSVPFFFKAARMTWSATWESLLHTWNVAREHAADSLERPLPLPMPTPELFFAPLDDGPDDATADCRALFAAPNPDLQTAGYRLLTTTQAQQDLGQQIASFEASQADFAANFTRPHFIDGQLRFAGVRQDFGAARVGMLCDHLLVNVRTSELRRLQISAGVRGAGPLDGIVQELTARAPVLADNPAEILVYARHLLDTQCALDFAAAREQLVLAWRRMTHRNPTLFVARTPTLVTRLAAQKQALAQELHRLRDCAENSLDFTEARAAFLNQIATGLDQVPFYPDVMLRRLLVRVFAEGWLDAAHLQGLFSQSLGLTDIRLQPADFAADAKPRAAFTHSASGQPSRGVLTM